MSGPSSPKNNNNSAVHPLFQAEVDILLKWISPDSESNKKRRDIANMVAQCAFDNDSCSSSMSAYSCGSSAQKAYLPESDLDLVIIAPPTSSTNSNEDVDQRNTRILINIVNSFCQEVLTSSSKSYKSLNDNVSISGFQFPCNMTSTIDQNQYVVRNVELINARTKIVSCKVNNISVDITVNQISGLASALFIEEADLLIGHNHLLKKSILLIKAWCLHESPQLCGKPIISAKEGMLSSYAISVLILHLFNKFPIDSITHPFDTLRAFLYTYSSIDYWNPDKVISINGIVPTSEHSPDKPIRQSSNRFAKLQNKIQGLLRGSKSNANNKPTGSFHYKFCNIEDPVDPYNNLGYSLNRYSLQTIHLALSQGHHQLEGLLPWHPFIISLSAHPISSRIINYEEVAAAHDIWLLRRFFQRCTQAYQPRPGYTREDMKDHPLQYAPAILSSSSMHSPGKKSKMETKASPAPDPFASDIIELRNRFNKAVELFASKPPVIQQPLNEIDVSNVSVECKSVHCSTQTEERESVKTRSMSSECDFKIGLLSTGIQTDKEIIEDSSAEIQRLNELERDEVYIQSKETANSTYKRLPHLFTASVIAVMIGLCVPYIAKQLYANQMDKTISINISPLNNSLSISPTTTNIFDSVEIVHWVRHGDSLSLSISSKGHIEATNDGILKKSVNQQRCSKCDKLLYGWKRNGFDLYEGLYRLSPSLAQYTLSKAGLDDGGIYESFAVYPNGTEISLAKTIVLVSEPPYVKTKPLYSELKQGERLALQLLYEGSPEPSFEWRRNGFSLTSLEYITSTNTLVVEQANRSHSGTYSCMLKNFAGEYLWLEATVVVRD